MLFFGRTLMLRSTFGRLLALVDIGMLLDLLTGYKRKVIHQDDRTSSQSFRCHKDWTLTIAFSKATVLTGLEHDLRE